MDAFTNHCQHDRLVWNNYNTLMERQEKQKGRLILPFPIYYLILDYKIYLTFVI